MILDVFHYIVDNECLYLAENVIEFIFSAFSSFMEAGKCVKFQSARCKGVEVGIFQISPIIIIIIIIRRAVEMSRKLKTVITQEVVVYVLNTYNNNNNNNNANRAYLENANFNALAPSTLKFHTFSGLHETRKC